LTKIKVKGKSKLTYNAVLEVKTKADYNKALEGHFYVGSTTKLEISAYLEKGQRAVFDRHLKGRKIYVNELPFDSTKEFIKRLFSKFGHIEEAWVRSNEQKQALYAFITFADIRVANELVAKGKLMIEGHGYVKIAHYNMKSSSSPELSRKYKKGNKVPGRGPRGSLQGHSPTKIDKRRKTLEGGQFKSSESNPLISRPRASLEQPQQHLGFDGTPYNPRRPFLRKISQQSFSSPPDFSSTAGRQFDYQYSNNYDNCFPLNSNMDRNFAPQPYYAVPPLMGHLAPHTRQVPVFRREPINFSFKDPERNIRCFWRPLRHPKSNIRINRKPES
jgi:RNA recognition motif-containing protein